ncbi:hypothetical protein Tco_0650756 [Tanacetum coccineum]
MTNLQRSCLSTESLTVSPPHITPKTSGGKLEVSNRGLEAILERTVEKIVAPGRQLDDALWPDFPDCEDSRACSIPQEFHILSFILGIQYPNLID